MAGQNIWSNPHPPSPENAEDEMINVSNFDKRRTFCAASSQIFKKSMPLEITWWITHQAKTDRNPRAKPRQLNTSLWDHVLTIQIVFLLSFHAIMMNTVTMLIKNLFLLWEIKPSNGQLGIKERVPPDPLGWTYNFWFSCTLFNWISTINTLRLDSTILVEKRNLLFWHEFRVRIH